MWRGKGFKKINDASVSIKLFMRLRVLILLEDASLNYSQQHVWFEKRSWIEGVFVFLCNKSLAQTQFVHLESVTIFTASWHSLSEGLYKRCRISLKSYQRFNSVFIYVFDAECKWLVHLFVLLMGTKWKGLKPKLTVVCLPSSPADSFAKLNIQ